MKIKINKLPFVECRFFRSKMDVSVVWNHKITLHFKNGISNEEVGHYDIGT